MKRSAHLSNRD